MKEYQLRVFMYKCNCGHIVKTYFDYGIPQEYYKCRKCGSQLKREEEV